MNRASGTTLTLLFTDVVSSTEVSVRLGSSAAALRRAHDRILREQFEVSGGSVVKHTGDGFFVTFPSATQGIECAAAIQRAIAGQQAEGRYPELAVRIGIHTGEPVFDEGDYFGVDVAIASRIMNEAAGGEVLCSDVAHQLARSRTSLRFDPPEAYDLKGLPEPILLRRVRWDLDPPQPHASRFIGRTAERSRLNARLDAARRGQGSTVLITGEPGLGKTRLARELCVEARDMGMLVLSGRASQADAVLPYDAVTDALRAHLRGRPVDEVRALLGDDAAVLARVLPELSGTFTDAAAPESLTPEAERYRLFEAVTRMLVRLVDATSGVLFLDDLHWADRTTGRLVEHLVRRVASAPLLLVVTYRDAELPEDHPLAALAYEIVRGSLGESIALDPLSPHDAALLAEHVLGEALPATVADELYAAAEGNPFFTEQLVTHMRDRAAAGAQRTDAWGAPDAVRHVLLGRLDRLGAETRNLLAGCAVLGRDLTPARIAAATGVSGDAVMAALDEALSARVLREERDAYPFAHPLIKDTVYQSLSTPRRQLIHRGIANGLERLYEGELDLHVQEVAHHFLESAKSGAEMEKAVAYARRAAAQASAMFAYDEAATYYRRATEAIAYSGGNTAERCELTISLGEMLTRAGDAPGADEAFQAGAELARTLGRADLLSRAALGLGDVRRTGAVVDEPLIALLEDALDALGTDDDLLRARLLARLTSAQYLVRPVSELQAQGIAATDLAERLGDDETKVYVWRALRLFRQEQHDAVARLRDARELEALAVRIGDRESALYAKHMQIDTLVELGRIGEADALIAAFEDEAQALRQPFYLWLAAVYRGMRALLEGRWSDAEDLAQRAFSIGREAQTATNLALQFLAAKLFAIRLEQGRLGELVPMMREFARGNAAVRWEATLAFAQSELGDDAEARVEFESIVTPTSVDVPDDFNQSMLLVFLADLCDRFNDVARARPLYDRLLPFGGRTVVVGAPAACAGAASRLLGLLAGVLGRWDDAERHFADALALNAQLSSRPLVAWTQFNFASTLLRRGRAGDCARARALLDEAVATATGLGMARLRERAMLLGEHAALRG